MTSITTFNFGYNSNIININKQLKTDIFKKEQIIEDLYFLSNSCLIVSTIDDKEDILVESFVNKAYINKLLKLNTSLNISINSNSLLSSVSQQSNYNIKSILNNFIFCRKLNYNNNLNNIKYKNNKFSNYLLKINDNIVKNNNCNKVSKLYNNQRFYNLKDNSELKQYLQLNKTISLLKLTNFIIKIIKNRNNTYKDDNKLFYFNSIFEIKSKYFFNIDIILKLANNVNNVDIYSLIINIKNETYYINKLIYLSEKAKYEQAKTKIIIDKIAHEIKTPINSIFNISCDMNFSIFNKLDLSSIINNLNYNNSIKANNNFLFSKNKTNKLSSSPSKNVNCLTINSANKTNNNRDSSGCFSFSNNNNKNNFNELIEDFNLKKQNIIALAYYCLFTTSNILDINIDYNSSTYKEKNRINILFIIKSYAEVLESLIRVHKGEENFKNIQTSLVIPDNINDFELEINEKMLNQIMINLISNSVKYTNYGSISIECDIAEDQENVLTFRVIDTGCGIPKEIQDELLEADYEYNKNCIINTSTDINKDLSNFSFYNQSNKKINNFKDIKLGLRRAIITASVLKSEISIKSNKNDGTVISITFPKENLIKLNNESDADTILNDNLEYNLNHKLSFLMNSINKQKNKINKSCNINNKLNDCYNKDKNLNNFKLYSNDQNSNTKSILCSPINYDNNLKKNVDLNTEICVSSKNNSLFLSPSVNRFLKEYKDLNNMFFKRTSNTSNIKNKKSFKLKLNSIKSNSNKLDCCSEKLSENSRSISTNTVKLLDLNYFDVSLLNIIKTKNIDNRYSCLMNIEMKDYYPSYFNSKNTYNNLYKLNLKQNIRSYKSLSLDIRASTLNTKTISFIFKKFNNLKKNKFAIKNTDDLYIHNKKKIINCDNLNKSLKSNIVNYNKKISYSRSSYINSFNNNKNNIFLSGIVNIRYSINNNPFVKIRSKYSKNSKRYSKKNSSYNFLNNKFSLKKSMPYKKSLIINKNKTTNYKYNYLNNINITNEFNMLNYEVKKNSSFKNSDKFVRESSCTYYNNNNINNNNNKISKDHIFKNSREFNKNNTKNLTYNFTKEDNTILQNIKSSNKSTFINLDIIRKKKLEEINISNNIDYDNKTDNKNLNFENTNNIDNKINNNSLYKRNRSRFLSNNREEKCIDLQDNNILKYIDSKILDTNTSNNNVLNLDTKLKSNTNNIEKNLNNVNTSYSLNNNNRLRHNSLNLNSSECKFFSKQTLPKIKLSENFNNKKLKICKFYSNNNVLQKNNKIILKDYNNLKLKDSDKNINDHDNLNKIKSNKNLIIKNITKFDCKNINKKNNSNTEINNYNNLNDNISNNNNNINTLSIFKDKTRTRKIGGFSKLTIYSPTSNNNKSCSNNNKRSNIRIDTKIFKLKYDLISKGDFSSCNVDKLNSNNEFNNYNTIKTKNLLSKNHNQVKQLKYKTSNSNLNSKEFKNNNNNKSSSNAFFSNNNKYYIACIDDNFLLRSSLKNNILNAIKDIIDTNSSNQFKNIDILNNVEIIEGKDGADLIKFIVDDQSNGNKILCIFSDESMEYINGSNAMIILKELESKQKIKYLPHAICVTAFQDDYTKEYLIKSGFNNILDKNPKKETLKDILSNL